jgi:hypothetical protein
MFSLSIVRAVMIFLLGATLCAVMTWITPKCLNSKAIPQKIDAGEGLAMTPALTPSQPYGLKSNLDSTSRFAVD